MESKDNQDIDLVRRYLNGTLDARAMHELELRAQKEPLLADLMAGMEAAAAADNKAHLSSIDRRITARIAADKNKRRPTWKWVAAACLLITTGAGSYWLLQQQKSTTIAANKAEQVAPATNNNTTLTTDSTVVANDPPYEQKPNAAPRKSPATDTTGHNENMPVGDAPPPKATTESQLRSRELKKDVTHTVAKQGNNLDDNYLGYNKYTTTYSQDNNESAEPSLSKEKSFGIRTDSVSKKRFSDVNDFILAKNKDSVDALSEVVISGYVAPVERKAKGTLIGRVPGVSVGSDAAGAPEQDYTPAHPGIGWDKYSTYLKENAVLPTGEEGVVKLSFTVAANGYISDIKIIKSLSAATDRKAIELVEKGPVWTGNKSGQPEMVKLRIRFRK